MKSEKRDKCTRKKAKGMAMELSDFINDFDLSVEHIRLFKTGMDNVLYPYKRDVGRSMNENVTPIILSFFKEYQSMLLLIYIFY